MKKLFSLTALCALFYAAPACANFVWGNSLFSSYFASGGYAILLSLVLLSLAIQALLLRFFLKGISWDLALLMTCAGNIPSMLLGIVVPDLMTAHARIAYIIGLPRLEVIIGLCSLTLSNALIMLITLTIIFHYPVKKLITPLLLGNFVTYMIIAIWMLWLSASGACH